MRMMLSIQVPAFCLMALPALGQAIPELDVDAWCKRIASFGTPGRYNQTTYDECFDGEQLAYNDGPVAGSADAAAPE